MAPASNFDLLGDLDILLGGPAAAEIANTGARLLEDSQILKKLGCWEGGKFNDQSPEEIDTVTWNGLDMVITNKAMNVISGFTIQFKFYLFNQVKLWNVP